MNTDKSDFFVAGRIEFLGKHTDYCGGRSIVCAIDKGFNVSFTATDNEYLTLINDDTNEVITFRIRADLPIRENHWANYPQTVAKRIAENFKSRELVGADINFTSNLPQAAGVSSSSALIIATFAAISKANNLPEFDEYKQNIQNELDLANYLGCLENGYDFGGLKGNKGVGTFGGSQDQTAIICCKHNTLSRFSFCPVRREDDFPLSEDYVFIIASSGVIAEKTGAAKEKYNRLSLMTQEICKQFDSKLTLAEIVEKYGFETVKSKLNDQDLINRVAQFHTESFEIIPQVSELLKNGEVEKIGELIDLSHKNADKLLGNQTAETNFLQQNAREIGAIASSAFGAGFGGSVYALVKKSDAENFLDEWKTNYTAKLPQLKSEFFITQPSQSQL
jgi:galactokinase